MNNDQDTRQGTIEPKTAGSKARKRSTAKPAPDAGKRSLNLRVDDETYKRLSVHALMAGSTISALVESYAKSLREFSMPHRLGGAASGQNAMDD